MKKLFLVLLLFVFVGISQAQNTDKPTSTMTEQQIANKIYEKTLELLRVKVANSIALDQATIDSLQNASTSNGAKEATQLQVLAEMQNKINMGGAQTYSLRRGNFTATLKAGGKSIAIAGLNGGTVSYLNFAYGWLINSTTGAKTYLTNAVDSVAGTSIRFPSATAFTATDVLGELVFIYPEKALDPNNDANKSLEQSPLWAHYEGSANPLAETNHATGLVRYDYSGEGYEHQAIHFDNISASALSGIKIFATESPNASTTTETGWVDMTTTIFGADSLGFTTATSKLYTISTPMQVLKWRIRVYFGHATNSVTAWIRRWF